jgi:hypothetical protein
MNDWKEAVVGGGDMWDRESTIQGVLKKKQSEVGPNESMLYTIKTKDGDVGVWGSTVLDTKFEEIEVGYEVMIEPLGEVVSEKTKRKYMDFKVLYRPAEMVEARDELDEPFPD